MLIKILSMNSKVLIGGLVAGVAFFILGWVIYGIVLGSYMQENTNQCATKPMEEWAMWALILSNFVWGFMIAMVLNWSNTRGFGQGMQRSFMLALLIMLAFDLGFYAMSTMFNNMKAMFVDVAATTIIVSIVGGIIGAILGSGKKPETTT